MSFENKIQEWVSIDNKIKIYNDKIKELREKKTELNTELTYHAEQNGLDKSVIQISDGKLKFTKNAVSTPLSFKYIEKTLGEIIPNKEQATIILNHIKNNREVKMVHELKRYMN
jgi:hypothetical protein